MSVNYRLTVARCLVATAMAIVAVEAVAATPLCASPSDRKLIQSAMFDAPKSSPSSIASTTGLTEAAVVHGMPVKARISVPTREFESVWQKLTEWEDALVVVLSSDSVFELAGPVPNGSAEGGYFDFDDPDSFYGGHLKLDRMAAIYLLSTEDNNGGAHQVAFYDQDGRRVFSVYVPRDKKRRLKTQPHNRFMRMQHDFGARAKRTLLSDMSCLWENNVEPQYLESPEGHNG